MPSAFASPCAHGGCTETVTGARCDEHKRQRQEKIREAQRGYDRSESWADRKHDPAQRFYSSRKWQKTREAYKAEKPLCERCDTRGRVRAADMVHHVTPIKQGGEKLDWGNLESLCRPCHREAHR